MTARPILFSAPMIRALLEGRKTQTRRVLKPQPDRTSDPSGMGRLQEKRPYALGDRLYVKERAAWLSRQGWRYMADNDDLTDAIDQGELGKWCSPIHMPRRASRLTLVVTDVRVQRLQDISGKDAIAEGCAGWAMADYESRTPVGEFRDIWNSLHGLDAWDQNPWVCALTFTVHRCNIDQMEGDA